MSNLALAPPPFRLQTKPAEAFAHPSWREARARTLAALRRGQSVVVLGPAGTGKTLLLQSLEAGLHADGKRAASLGAGTADADVLLVDEAGRLDSAALERLCAMRQPFVAAGLPAVESRVVTCHRSIEIVRLLPLAPEDVARYLIGQLAATGRARDLFELDAILGLAKHSGGLFRLVIMLAGSAMFLAEQEDAPHVTGRHVDEAAAMREVLQEEDAPPAQAATVSCAQEQVPNTGCATSEQMPPPLAPAHRRYRVASLAGAAGLTGLGLAILAAAWMVSDRHHTPTERTAERAPSTPDVLQLAQPPLPQATPQLTERQVPALSSAPRAVPPLAPRPMPIPPPQAARPLPLPPTPTATAPVAFRGPIMNETMGQSGQLSLTIRSDAAGGSVVVHFHAYAGLIGTGDLTGNLRPDGRLSLSGQLMMGHNPYDCSLSGIVSGGALTGSATFVRAGGSGSARSTFTLTRL